MNRHLALIFPLILLPGVAWAASGGGDALGDVSASLIAYSKVGLLLVGLLLTVRLVFLYQQGRDTASTWWLIVASIVLPGMFLALWAHLPESGTQAGPVASGGRAYIEAFLADAGLLNANLLGSADWFRLALLAVLFASLACVLTKAAAMDEQQAVATVKGWAIPTVLLLAVFSPGWTMLGAGSSEEVLSRLGAASKGQQSQPVPFSMSATGEILAKMSQSKGFRLSQSREPEIPVALSLVNGAMDQAIQRIALLLGGQGFSQFGLINSRLTSNSIQFSFPGSPDLQSRMSWFVENCYLVAVRAKGTQLAGELTKSNAGEFNPFAALYLPFYKKHPLCQTMLDGGYVFGDHTYRTPLADEVLGVLAYGDQALRRWNGWASVDEAIAAAPRLRQVSFNLPDSKLYFANMADALVARAMQGTFLRFPGPEDSAQQMIQSRRTAGNDNWFTTLAGLMGGQGYALMSSAKGAAETEQVNLKMPLWMGLAQSILLSLFPVVLLLSVIPGRASWVGYYLSVLFWSKSYIIPWALIGVADSWFQSLTGMTAAQELAWTQIIQQAQLYSPIMMGLLIFGPMAGHQMMSRGGGAA